jgi:mitochondrial fission protein ELM1
MAVQSVSPVPRLDEVESAAPARRVWLVVGDKLGDNGQVEIIADALDWPTERKNLRFKAQYVLGKPPFRSSLYHVDIATSDPLTPPWPDLVLTVGRRPAMAAMWIKAQSRGSTKVVIVGRARAMLSHFDLVLTTPQFPMPDRTNVLRLDLPLQRVDRARVATAAAAWRERLAAVARPLTAVLVGGPTKPFVFDGAVARDFMAAVRRSTHDEGALFVTTSRRTPPDVVEALAAVLPPGSQLFRWQADTSENPYLALLGLADRFVVTGDSVSMMVEVARLGRPLAIFPLPVGNVRRSRLKERLTEVLQRRSSRGVVGALTTRLADALYDAGLIGYSRDFEKVHRALIDRGFAVMLGERFAPNGGPAPDDVPRIVHRIRSLFDGE